MRSVVALFLAALLVSGCGINPGPARPESTRYDADSQDASVPLAEELMRPERVATASELVMKFLTAAADDASTRLKTTGSYLVPGAYWLPPPNEVNVVRVVDGPVPVTGADGSTLVRLRVQHVGVLNPGGQLLPSAKPAEELEFAVVYVNGEGLHIRNPPQMLLLQEDALTIYFETKALYFRGKDGRTLVPDLRYVPRRLPPEAKAELLVRRLYDGAPGWLAPAVNGLPAETRPKDRVTLSQGSLVVNLTTAPKGDDYEKLAEQLAMTLGATGVSTLEIRVQGQVLGDPKHPEDPKSPMPMRYALVDGSVRRLSGISATSTPAILPPEYNRDLAAVAFTPDEGRAVLVQHDGEAKKISLWSKDRAALVPVSLPVLQPKQIPQPVWLDSVTVLVAVEGTLYQVGTDGRATPVVNGENVTAFSLGAERVRVAFVRDQQLMVAALLHNQDGTLAIGPEPQVVPTIFASVHNVAFSNVLELTVAGADTRSVFLASMNPDGASPYPYRDVRFALGAVVSHLVAWPYGYQPPLFEVEGQRAYEAQLSSWVPLVVDGPPPSPGIEPRVTAPSYGI